MYKKMLAVLMASAMLFVIAGCDFPWENSSDDNGGGATQESVASEESENETENDTESAAGTTDNTFEDSSVDGASEDTEKPAEPMEVQEDAELQLDEGQEGAW